MLLSAYDLHYRHIPRPRRAVTEITFVDSGGYETSAYQDLSTAYHFQATRSPWNTKLLLEVLDAWPERVPAVFVGFDRYGTPQAQVEECATVLGPFSKHLHAILLKPATRRIPSIDVAAVAANVTLLSVFHIVGIAEKELGESALVRMESIARIRMALDAAGLQRIPIHIFGSLDPISVPLYFLAGAEIFDGLTWLRYGYHSGAAMYIQNAAALQFELGYTDDQVKVLNLQRNLAQLSALSNQMRRFLLHGDFSQFDEHGPTLERAYDLLKARVPGVH